MPRGRSSTFLFGPRPLVPKRKKDQVSHQILKEISNANFSGALSLIKENKELLKEDPLTYKRVLKNLSDFISPYYPHGENYPFDWERYKELTRRDDCKIIEYELDNTNDSTTPEGLANKISARLWYENVLRDRNSEEGFYDYLEHLALDLSRNEVNDFYKYCLLTLDQEDVDYLSGELRSIALRGPIADVVYDSITFALLSGNSAKRNTLVAMLDAQDEKTDRLKVHLSKKDKAICGEDTKDMLMAPECGLDQFQVGPCMACMGEVQNNPSDKELAKLPGGVESQERKYISDTSAKHITEHLNKIEEDDNIDLRDLLQDIKEREFISFVDELVKSDLANQFIEKSNLKTNELKEVLSTIGKEVRDECENRSMICQLKVAKKARISFLSQIASLH